MYDNHEPVKHVIDTFSISTVIASWLGVFSTGLTIISTMFVIVWTGIRIYETKTIQRWLGRE